MDERLAANRAQWDERTAVHVGSAFYDVDRFRAGACTLGAVEVEEVGDVAGKRLLHLQCHFGLDTLSWARRGALATGVDFSPAAIEVARGLAEETGLAARFVGSDVYALPDALQERFDVVFTSYGVLTWLPDLERWASVVARFLADGGAFHLVEEHPLGAALAEEDGRLVVADAYFDTGPIEVRADDGTYTDPSATFSGPSYQWHHPLSDVVCALADAGLAIEHLHEFPFGSWQRLPSMMKGEDGYWRLPGCDDLPFLYSIRARRR